MKLAKQITFLTAKSLNETVVKPCGLIPSACDHMASQPLRPQPTSPARELQISSHTLMNLP